MALTGCSLPSATWCSCADTGDALLDSRSRFFRTQARVAPQSRGLPPACRAALVNPEVTWAGGITRREPSQEALREDTPLPPGLLLDVTAHLADCPRRPAQTDSQTGCGQGPQVRRTWGQRWLWSWTPGVSSWLSRLPALQALFKFLVPHAPHLRSESLSH